MNNKLSSWLGLIALILSVLAIILVFTYKSAKQTTTTKADSTKAALKIAFVNVDTLLNHYDLYNTLSIQLMQKQQEYEKQLQSKLLSLQQRSMKLQNAYNKGLITTADFQRKAQQLQNEQQQIQQWYNEKSNELANDQAMIMQQVKDSIDAVIKDYNKNAGYDYILVATAMLYGDPKFDITDTIVQMLNARANVINPTSQTKDQSKK